MAARPFRRSANVCRQQFRNRRKRCFRIQQQEEELLARHRLELRQRQPRTFLGQSNSTQRRDAALIDEPSRHADIDQAADGALLKTAFGDPRFQFRDALVPQLRVQQGFSRPSRPGDCRVNSDRGLKRRRSVDREEYLTRRVFPGFPARHPVP